MMQNKKQAAKVVVRLFSLVYTFKGHTFVTSITSMTTQQASNESYAIVTVLLTEPSFLPFPPRLPERTLK
jgi:hypothetical protein